MNEFDQYFTARNLEKEFDDEVKKVVNTFDFIEGPHVFFEERPQSKFARMIGRKAASTIYIVDHYVRVLRHIKPDAETVSSEERQDRLWVEYEYQDIMPPEGCSERVRAVQIGEYALRMQSSDGLDPMRVPSRLLLVPTEESKRVYIALEYLL